MVVHSTSDVDVMNELRATAGGFHGRTEQSCTKLCAKVRRESTTWFHNRREAVRTIQAIFSLKTSFVRTARVSMMNSQNAGK